MCSDSPDMTGVNAAATANAEVAKEALDWYKQAYADQAPDRQRAADTAQRVSESQIAGMDSATAQAKDLADYNKTTFRPLEQSLVSDAQNYDTAGRRMQASQAAQADVDQSFGATQQATERELARSGVAPGSGKAMSLMQDNAIAQAAARAGAGTTAVRNVEQQGYARKMDAASLGRNIASNQATQQQIANSAGTSATESALSSLGATTSGNATMGAGFNSSVANNTAAGNLYGTMAGINQQGSAANSQALSSAAMMAAMYFSDEKVKKKTGRMLSTAKALKQVEATPVHEGWQYDPSKGGPDDGGQPHDGPMAQRVRKTMGNAAAPGGKVIDPVTMNGRMMAAVQELSKRVKKLERHA